MSLQEDAVEEVIQRQLESQLGRITTESGLLDEIVERHLEVLDEVVEKHLESRLESRLEVQLTSLRADLFNAFRELRVALDLSDACVPRFGCHDIPGMCTRGGSANAIALAGSGLLVP